MATKQHHTATAKAPEEFYNEATGHWEQKKPVAPLGWFEVKKIVRDRREIMPGEQTIGQFIDDYINDAKTDGQELLSLHLELTQED